MPPAEPLNHDLPQFRGEIPQFHCFGGTDFAGGIILQSIALATAGVEIVRIVLPIFTEDHW